jgi:hypothetical protein
MTQHERWWPKLLAWWRQDHLLQQVAQLEHRLRLVEQRMPASFAPPEGASRQEHPMLVVPPDEIPLEDLPDSHLGAY